MFRCKSNELNDHKIFWDVGDLVVGGMLLRGKLALNPSIWIILLLVPVLLMLGVIRINLVLVCYSWDTR